MLGICVSPRVPLLAEHLEELRPRGLASILYRLSDLDDLLLAARACGVGGSDAMLMVSLNNECLEVGSDWSGFEDACRGIAQRWAGRKLAVCLGHELDLFWSRDERDVPPEFAADLVNVGGPILRAAGILVLPTPVAGPRWPEYLERVLALCHERPDGVAIDAYGQVPDGSDVWGFGTLRDAVLTANHISGLPVWLREYGREQRDCGGPEGQAEYLRQAAATIADLGPELVPFAAWFGLTEEMGKPEERGDRSLGLLTADGERTPAYHAFAVVNAAPIPVPVTPPEVPIVPDYRAYARGAALGNGIDPDIFVRQIQQESGFDPGAYNPSGATGIAQIIPRFHPTVDPTDPIASLDYAAAWMGDLYRQHGSYARALAAYNWGPGNVATWDETRAGLPAETEHYLDVILGADWDSGSVPTPVPTVPTATYNPDARVDQQDNDYECSVESMEWLLRSLGRDPAEAWVNALLVPALVTPELGLLDGSGGGLAAWFDREYGDDGSTAGLRAMSRRGVSFDDIVAVAGHQPVLAGSAGWYHWVGVRGYDEAIDTLRLANPANGYGLRGVTPGQSLTRGEFAALAPWAMVTVPLAEPAPVAPPAPAPIDRVAELEAEVARLNVALADARTKLGYLGTDVAKALREALADAEAATDTLEREAA